MSTHALRHDAATSISVRVSGDLQHGAIVRSHAMGVPCRCRLIRPHTEALCSVLRREWTRRRLRDLRGWEDPPCRAVAESSIHPHSSGREAPGACVAVSLAGGRAGCPPPVRLGGASLQFIMWIAWGLSSCGSLGPSLPQTGSQEYGVKVAAD